MQIFSLILTSGGAGFICGAALMYLVMKRTIEKRAAERELAEAV